MWRTQQVSEVAPDGTAFDLSGEGPAVVLIHGLGLSRRLWDSHLPALTSCRVLRYDLYGHGESRSAKEPLSLRVFAQQLADLMDHVGMVQAHIVGFSIGGMINRRFALDFPNKIASLVIMNSPHNRGAAAQDAVEARAKAVREQGAFATFDAALKRWFTPNYLMTGEGPRHVRDWRGQVDAEGYAQTAWVLANGVRELIAPKPPITAPALVMTCENDSGSTPQMARDIAAEIASAQTIIVPRLQHLGLMEDPAAFTAPLCAFLAQRSHPT